MATDKGVDINVYTVCIYNLIYVQYKHIYTVYIEGLLHVSLFPWAYNRMLKNVYPFPDRILSFT